MAANADPCRESAGGPGAEPARALAAELFDRGREPVERICRAMLRDDAEAEDAAQQTFLASLQALLGGTRPRDPDAWLAAIARNECLRRIRARMRTPLAPAAADPVDPGRDVHGEVVARAEAALLWQEIAALPGPQREALVLRELGGRSYRQLAAELGVTTPAVESLLVRARGRLRGRLRAALRALDLAGLASAGSAAAARLLAGDVAPRLAAPFAVKGALVTASVVALGGGTVASQERSAQPHAARARPAVTLRDEQQLRPAPVAVVGVPVEPPAHPRRGAAPRHVATPVERPPAEPRLRVEPVAHAAPEPAPRVVTPAERTSPPVTLATASEPRDPPETIEAPTPVTATPGPTAAEAAAAPAPETRSADDGAQPASEGHDGASEGETRGDRGSTSSGHGDGGSTSGDGRSTPSGHGAGGPTSGEVGSTSGRQDGSAPDEGPATTTAEGEGDETAALVEGDPGSDGEAGETAEGPGPGDGGDPSSSGESGHGGGPGDSGDSGGSGEPDESEHGPH